MKKLVLFLSLLRLALAQQQCIISTVGAPTGDAIPIVLTVGGASSQPGVTISVSAGP
jgi:hypothetical protein